MQQTCIFQTSAKIVGFHTWWGILGLRQPKRMKLQGWILRKSKIPHLGNTWIHLEPDLLSKTSDRTRVNWHKPKREISSQHKKPHFYCKGDTPGITCPKGWRCYKPESWALLGQVLTVSSSSLCSSPFANTGMLLHEIIPQFPQFPNFHQPHLPPAQCLLKAVFSRAGTTPKPQSLAFCWDSYRYLKEMKEHALNQPLDATCLLQSL